MLRLARQTLHARKSTFIAAFLTLLCASALICAAGVLAESGVRGSADSYRYTSADAVVTSPQTFKPVGGDFTTTTRLPESVGLPADLTEELEEVPEVSAAISDHRLPLQITSGASAIGLTATGHTWEMAAVGPFTLAEGTPPEEPGEIVLSRTAAASLQVSSGDTVTVHSRTRPFMFHLSGIYEESADGHHSTSSEAEQGVLFFHEEDLSRLTPDQNTVDSIAVVAAQDVQGRQLEDALNEASRDTQVSVATGAAIGGVEHEEVDTARGLLLTISGSFGGFAVLISLFIVAGMLALSLNARRREFAVLRAIGATPTQILALVSYEVVLLALIAGALGALPGFLIAELMHTTLVSLGVLPMSVGLALSPLPFIAAVLLTTLTAWGSAAAAAAGPARVKPVEALRDAAQEPQPNGRWRTTAALVCLTLGSGAALMPLVLPSDAGAAGTSTATLLLVVGAALIGPQLLGPVVRVVVQPLRRLGISGFLAAEACQSQVSRLSRVLTPLLLSVGFTLAMVHSQAVLNQAVSDQIDGGLVATSVITEYGSGGIDAEVVDHIEAIPETGLVTATSETEILLPYEVFGDPNVSTVTARSVSAAAITEALDPGVVSGSLKDLSGRSIALEQSTATIVGASLDDTIEVVLGDGTPVQLNVEALYERGLGLGEALLPAEILDNQLPVPTHALVSPAEGISDEQLQATLTELIAQYPTLSLTDQQEFADQARAETTTAAWVNLMGLAVIIGFIGIATVNNVVMSTLARSREFALLRLIGATRTQVLWSLRGEALVIIVLAVALGTIMAGLPLTVLSLALLNTPFPAGSAWTYALVVAWTAVITICSILLPGRRALRTPETSRNKARTPVPVTATGER